MELPDNWHGIENKEFFVDQLKIPADQAESTALILVKIEGDNVTKYISVTHDMELYPDDAAYSEGIDGNKKALEGADCKIQSHQTMQNRNGFRVDHMMVKAADILMSQYYIHINELLLCFATQVTGKGDNDDNVMANIVFSLNM